MLNTWIFPDKLANFVPLLWFERQIRGTWIPWQPYNCYFVNPINKSKEMNQIN